MTATSGVGAQTLKQAFDAAWSRQPEAIALALRRDAALAQQQAAQAWTPEPLALTLSNKTDRFQRDMGARELEVGVAIPLWLPGERARSGALADAETRGVESRALAAQLRTAGVLREAWWQRQRAQVELDVARDQLANARALAADVTRRMKAGDLARADQHQADGAVAAAESAEARGVAALAAASGQLRIASGGIATVAGGAASTTSEPEPSGAAATTLEPSMHPALAALQDRAAVAESAAALGTVRSRANPELTLATTRERDVRGERYDPSITLALRIPFGAGSRHAARTATAQAEATELQAELALEQERIGAEQATSGQRVVSARAQLAAAERRAALAQASLGFFDKSFRLGETDLPTRLRIEAEATEARRQAASARIEVAAAISQWRQALGLLPE
ncbi:TolC family protein [Variovorax sp. PAMC 28711]|uniref:TolC family protein n=1 Tax=Variovorax sp. PAMC 28711 TaxID=1795631 RepID=UPI001F0183C8|nr:TolC family protein [Variovorax sp. PAMC 28711]